ncbi:MAG: P-II family nitrogen regulator [Clostridiales bacterium]|nr:P-II family nitrogen regulator [Clostridiales bacterium]
MEYELIVTVVNRGFADLAVDAARAEGARGGTILHARGAGANDAGRFFGVSIQPEREVVLILVPGEIKQRVMRAISEHAGQHTGGHGIAFSLPVDGVAGLTLRSKEGGEPS